MEIREKLWLLGPGRRSEKTVFEQQFIFSSTERTALDASGSELAHGLAARLEQSGINQLPARQADTGSGIDAALIFCRLFARLAILLQQSGGHRVAEWGAVADEQGQGYWVWFEYEHDAVAAAAVVLSLKLLTELEPALLIPDMSGEAVELQEESIAGFLAVAQTRVLPKDAEAIIHAAHARDIPCVKLERPPYQGLQGAFRIRQNGLLKLGHCAHRLIVDGTLCVSRNAELLPLVHNRAARQSLLASLKLPMPRVDPEAGNCALSKHALRSAERIGYPISLNVTANNGQVYSWPDIASADDLRRVLDTARRYGTQVALQGMVTGEDWHLLLVGGEVLALLRAGGAVELNLLAAGTRQMAESLAGRLGSGILLVHLRSTDIQLELNDGGGAFLDFEPAPRLDEVLAGELELLDRVAAAYVDHLFPAGSESRVPIVAITGTNGKTTTSRMIETIARKSGRVTGMASTGGIYSNGQLFAKDGKGGSGRQFRLFEREEIDFVVMEEYFGSILRVGFAYQHCDVAVCTNVAEDHLGRIGVYDLAGIAATKVLAIKRARKAAVLNADNEFSLGMMQDAVAEKIGLVSMQLDAGALQAMLDRPGILCVLEKEQDETWLVIYDQGQRQALMAERDIPATFLGTAAHNTCNAMQAALACVFLGFSREQIRAALAGFTTDFNFAPGRLNQLDGLPFRFIMDYAHNLDGFRALCGFVDKQQVSGRKILCVAFSGDRQNREMQQAISYLAGHFDYFVCRRYPGLRGREPEEIPRLIERYLLEAGVPAESIQLALDHRKAIATALESARPGDLLVVLAGGSEFSHIWQQAEALKTGLA
jgi:UDP-N-acetylmuramyl tripeptide synthase